MSFPSNFNNAPRQIYDISLDHVDEIKIGHNSYTPKEIGELIESIKVLSKQVNDLKQQVDKLTNDRQQSSVA